MEILITSIIDLKKSLHNRPHQFIQHLVKNHNITVVSINDWWKGGQGNHTGYIQDFDDIFHNVKYQYLTEKKVSPVLQELFSGKRVKRLVDEGNFDLHLNYNTLVSGYFASKKLKTVYDIADDLTAMIRESPQIPGRLRNIGGMFGGVMLGRSIKNSARVTLTTDNLRAACKVPLDKSEIIPNGVDIARFRNLGPSAKRETGLDGFIIGYVGVLREWIDLEPVFSMLGELDDGIRLAVVGKEGRYYENIRLAKKYGVSDRVIFTGMVPYSRVPAYISAMDVCLMPFRRCAISESAVPLKLFEYMSCEKPVISARLSGIEKIAHDRIFYADDSNDYKDYINLLYNSPDLMKKMGRAGRKLVQECFDWTTLSEKMERLMLNVCDS
jgi:glycosyltransferase involved in cell wall biosynthesis